MPFAKGHKKSPKSGRMPGQQNRVTIEFKDAVVKLMNHAAPKMVKWLDQLPPDKALDMVCRFAEFVQPKLSRSEVDMNATVKTDQLSDDDLAAEIASTEAAIAAARGITTH